jgi:class 3 adenylate cyclase
MQRQLREVRIGINTGFCTVGNFGSEDRMDYTIIGNEVNLAARLQSHSGIGGILVAQETASLIKDTILTEEQEAVSVKGLRPPSALYRVVGIYDELKRRAGLSERSVTGFGCWSTSPRATRPALLRLSKMCLPG